MTHATPPEPLGVWPLDTRLLEQATADLCEVYEGIFSRETIERYVFESYTTLSRTAKIRT